MLSNGNGGFCKMTQCPESWTETANVFPEDLSTVWHLLVPLVLAGYSGKQKLCP